ncbi:MAG: GYF domain-containing protein, partial [Deltaproteobacteria bacterium]
LDLAANYREMSETLRKYVCERVDDEYGLDIPQLFIVNISFPEDVEKALDTRTKMGVIGDMNRFQQYQMGEAMTVAAANPSGVAGAGVGLGVGFGMASQMAQNLGRAGAPGAAVPPPPPGDAWHIAVGGQSQGPFTAAQIAEGIAAGQVNAGTLLWSPPLGNWTPAGQVPQFATRLASPPPPPPPK